MYRRIRRPSPALVVAGIALLFALGGTSVAAVNALPKNSVGAAQLKANAVTNPKIANGAVNNAKLAKNAVTSSKVADKSLTANDFADGQIPAGPQGPAGPAGAPGVSAYQVVSVTSPSAPSTVTTQSITATCPSGKKAIGGGGEITGAAKALVGFNDIHPRDDGTGYYVEAAETTPTLLGWEVKAYAVCATVAS